MYLSTLRGYIEAMGESSRSSLVFRGKQCGSRSSRIWIAMTDIKLKDIRALGENNPDATW